MRKIAGGSCPLFHTPHLFFFQQNLRLIVRLIWRSSTSLRPVLPKTVQRINALQRYFDAFKMFVSLLTFAALSLIRSPYSSQSLITSRILLLEPSPLNITLEVLAKSNTTKQTLFQELESIVTSRSRVLSDSPGDSVVVQPGRTLLLECTSDYPATWIYEGPSEGPGLQVVASTRREFTNFSDPSTYRFVATAKLLHLEEKTTGKYTCMSLMTSTMKHSYFIFIPGSEFFVLGPKQQTVPSEDADQEFMVVPCPISYPDPENSSLILDLYQTDPETGHPEKVLNAVFDPKIGFKRFYSDLGDNDPWGEYICTCGNASYTNSVTVIVEPPPETKVKPTIKGHFVQLNAHIKQMFVCEAKQNVTFYYSTEWSPHSRLLAPKLSKIMYTYSPGSEFPFSATLEADPAEFKTFALIHCVETIFEAQEISETNANDFVLHTWEYSNKGRSKNLKFTYNQNMDALICCTADSYARPMIEVLPPCDTFQECMLRYPHRYADTASLLDADLQLPAGRDLSAADAYNFLIASSFRDAKEKMTFYSSNFEFYSANYSNPAWKLLPSNCAAKKRFPDDHFSIVRCSIPSQPGIFKTFPSQEFIFARLNGTNVLSMEDLANTNSVIHLEASSEKNSAFTGEVLQARVGEELVVKCFPNRFLFSNNKYLALQRNNGIVEILRSEKYRKQRLLTNNGRTLPDEVVETIRIPDADVTAIYCLAPLWYSLGWRNASIALSIT